MKRIFIFVIFLLYLLFVIFYIYIKYELEKEHIVLIYFINLNLYKYKDSY